MIKTCKCVGMKKGKNKEGKPFVNLVFDVTDFIPEKDIIGNYYSTLFHWGYITPDIVGADVVCSVDRFGRVQDIEI